MLLKIANCYGVPPGYAHIRGQRLQPLCRSLGIRYAPALVSFTRRSSRYPARPETDVNIPPTSRQR